MIIVSGNHVCNMVVNTNSSMGTFIKEIDELPKWLIATATRHDNPDKGIVHVMIRYWEEELNYFFPFAPGSSQESEFKSSKRWIFLKNLHYFCCSSFEFSI